MHVEICNARARRALPRFCSPPSKASVAPRRRCGRSRSAPHSPSWPSPVRGTRRRPDAEQADRENARGHVALARPKIVGRRWAPVPTERGPTKCEKRLADYVRRRLNPSVAPRQRWVPATQAAHPIAPLSVGAAHQGESQVQTLLPVIFRGTFANRSCHSLCCELSSLMRNGRC
jgi:hypothetical protein